MLFAIERHWFRFRVYSIGHSEGDRYWLASFRHREHATMFVRALQGYPAANDPFDEVTERPR